jgi:hypothetical protein
VVLRHLKLFECDAHCTSFADYSGWKVLTRINNDNQSAGGPSYCKKISECIRKCDEMGEHCVAVTYSYEETRPDYNNCWLKGMKFKEGLTEVEDKDHLDLVTAIKPGYSAPVARTCSDVKRELGNGEYGT